MTIYRGREVTLVDKVIKDVIEPIMVKIKYVDNTLEIVKLSDLSFTKDEKTKIQKDAGRLFDNLNIIEEDTKKIK